MTGGPYDRSCLYQFNPHIPGRQLGLHRFLRPVNGEEEMNGLYLIAGLIVLILFAYLIAALLKPEWFE